MKKISKTFVTIFKKQRNFSMFDIKNMFILQKFGFTSDIKQACTSNTSTNNKNDQSSQSCSNTKSSCDDLPEIDLSSLSKNVYIEQIPTNCLSQFSYYIEADGKAIVVDPIRDIEYYLKLSTKRNSKIKYIGETHFHADFVSGHFALSNETGASIIFGPGASADFPIEKSYHEKVFKLSNNISIKVLHTPGHTLESCCFSIIENIEGREKVIAILTGDTVFKGEVGRPDLAVKKNVLSSRDLSSLMYESIKYLKTYPDNTILLPGHGSGSECGKSIKKGNYTTIGYEKKNSYAFNDNLLKEEFIEILTSNLPTPPQYFFHDAILNKKQIMSASSIFDNCKAFTYDDLKNMKDVVILDTRDVNQVQSTGILPGSICINLKTTFAIWTATLIEASKKIVLLSEDGKEEEAVIRLTRVGYDNIVGYLKGGIESWKGEKYSIGLISSNSFKEKMTKDKSVHILDVRNQNELDRDGFLKFSQAIPLSVLEKNYSNIPQDKPIEILCFSGMRATIAASILLKNGFKNKVSVVEGGVSNLMKSGVNLNSIKYDF